MTPLFDINTLQNYNRTEKLPFKCEYCSQTFYVEVKWIRLKLIRNKKIKFCNLKCMGLNSTKAINLNCTQCNITFFKQLNQIKKSKSGNNFCSNSCSAIYNNAHKTTGTRRSKLEKYLEEQLTKTYKDIEIHFNKKEAINSELDIYIPSLNLAFELNGIFHYEPIYGQDKLDATINNDNRKFQACLEKNIELVIIDSSGQKYFKEATSKKYLDIINNILNIKMSLVSPAELESA